MSNPIVQIKRGTVTTSSDWPGYFNFNPPLLLSGELCDIKVDGIHKLFLGDNSSTPILLNPEYTNTLTGTNEISGYKIYLDLKEETYTGQSLSNTTKSSYTITIPPAGENAAVGLITNGSQIIAGAKTFSGAITASSTLTATGKITANGGAEIKNNLIATSIISSTNTTKSSITLSNSVISMLSTKISLDGKLILTNDSYGTSLPTSGMEEGQIFFLLT